MADLTASIKTLPGKKDYDGLLLDAWATLGASDYVVSNGTEFFIVSNPTGSPVTFSVTGVADRMGRSQNASDSISASNAEYRIFGPLGYEGWVDPNNGRLTFGGAGLEVQILRP